MQRSGFVPVVCKSHSLSVSSGRLSPPRHAATILVKFDAFPPFSCPAALGRVRRPRTMEATNTDTWVRHREARRGPLKEFSHTCRKPEGSLAGECTDAVFRSDTRPVARWLQRRIDAGHDIVQTYLQETKQRGLAARAGHVELRGAQTRWARSLSRRSKSMWIMIEAFAETGVSGHATWLLNENDFAITQNREPFLHEAIRRGDTLGVHDHLEPFEGVYEVGPIREFCGRSKYAVEDWLTAHGHSRSVQCRRSRRE